MSQISNFLWKISGRGHATQELIASENEAAKRHGTGVYYDRHGRSISESRQSDNREARRKGIFNLDAGYGDWAGV